MESTTSNVIPFPRRGAPPPQEIAPLPPDALSFVVRRKPKSKGGGYNYWRIQRTGSYDTDCALGRELGREFIEFMGRNPTVGNATLLGLITNAMLATSRDAERLSGVEIGFLRAVSEAAMQWSVVALSISKEPL